MATSVNPNPIVEKEEKEVIELTGYKQIIKSLVAEGAKQFKAVVKNVNATEKEGENGDYTMVSFTLNKPVPGYISQDDGLTYELGTTNTIFTSLFAIVGAIKEDEELSWMGNSLLSNAKLLNLIMNGSELTILQQSIPQGTIFTNPFSVNGNEQSYDHDIIINYVIGFKLGKIGQKMADKLADKIMEASLGF